MARKLPQLQRVLDAPALASVAYGEIASSIYFALGMIALHALGLHARRPRDRRPALPHRRALVRRGDDGDSRDRRRRDLRARRLQRPRGLPHRLGALPRLPDRDRALGALRPALSRPRPRHRRDRPAAGRRDRGLRRRRGIAAIRLLRRTRLYGIGIAVPLLDLVTQVLLVIFGFAFLFSGSALTRDLSLGTHPTLARHRVRAAARDARVHRPRDGRQPRRGGAAARARPAAQPLQRGHRLVVVIYVLIACVGLSAFPSNNGTTALGTDWLRAPMMGIVAALAAAPAALVRARSCASTSA